MSIFQVTTYCIVLSVNTSRSLLNFEEAHEKVAQGTAKSSNTDGFQRGYQWLPTDFCRSGLNGFKYLACISFFSVNTLLQAIFLPDMFCLFRRVLLVWSCLRCKEQGDGFTGPFKLEIFYNSTHYFAGRFVQAYFIFLRDFKKDERSFSSNFFHQEYFMGQPEQLINSVIIWWKVSQKNHYKSQLLQKKTKKKEPKKTQQNQKQPNQQWYCEAVIF